MTAKRALVCAPLMPEYDRESGSRRIFDWIGLLREAGWEVSFAAREAPDGQRYARMLQQHGVATYVGFNQRLEQLLSAGRPDLAILAFWHVAETLLPQIRKASPATRILVDSIDLHFLRGARGTFRRENSGEAVRLLDQRFASEMTRELNVYAAADGVLTVSQKEADLLDDFLAGITPVFAAHDAEELPCSPLPYEDRKGILFIGNFRHAPNRSAVKYLCGEVLPLLAPSVLRDHPVIVLGTDLDEAVRGYGRGLAHVHMVGWVPSVVPYLHRARVTVLPLLYGAGTKRKLLQSLMAGTPSVSTAVGVEGLNLQDGEDVLVADTPAHFAGAIRRLLEDRALWQRLASQGRSHVTVSHGRDAARAHLAHVVAALQGRSVKYSVALPASGMEGPDSYDELIRHVREVCGQVLPQGATVLVVSRGDDRLLELGVGRAGHFPQTDSGVYAGHHPANSAEAIAHLEALRVKGGRFLLFPRTSFWWLEHYREFTAHLDGCYSRAWEDEHCVLYRLSAGAGGGPADGRADPLSRPAVERLRPPAPDLGEFRAAPGQTPRRKVLVLGVYLTDQPNTAEDIAANVAASAVHLVTQRWVALGNAPPPLGLAAVTVGTVRERTPKFKIINHVLSGEDLSAYDYVLLTDDDVVLPDQFVDRFITLQERLDFRIAQPARTNNSYIDHPIVGQQQGVVARQTRFVEIGPVVSFHKSCFDLVFPFDLTSPMGWGYENVWSYLLWERDMKMGILDALPVDHSLRKPVANYSWSEADAQRKELFGKHNHYTYDECFRVLVAVPLGGQQ
jgi:glycosyltransferase involved in cell wall biosynthesis